MSALTKRFITNNAAGHLESPQDIMALFDCDETPFLRAIGFGKAQATFEEWHLDALDTADTNNSHGDDTTAATIEPTARAGRDSEISYQTALAAHRNKLDLESGITTNVSRGIGGASTETRRRHRRGSVLKREGGHGRSPPHPEGGETLVAPVSKVFSAQCLQEVSHAC
jgi:hypothetical protein